MLNNSEPLVQPYMSWDYMNNNNMMMRTSSKKRRRDLIVKSVRFAPTIIVHPSDRTEQELNSSWYSPEELTVFKDERKEFVRALKKVNFDLNAIDSSLYCFRGFEAYFSIQINKETRKRRLFALKTVLHEQQRQRRLQQQQLEQQQQQQELQQPVMTDEQREEFLCAASCQATQWAKHYAIQLGIEDARQCLLSAFHFDDDDDDDEEEDVDFGDDVSEPAGVCEHTTTTTTASNSPVGSLPSISRCSSPPPSPLEAYVSPSPTDSSSSSHSSDGVSLSPSCSSSVSSSLPSSPVQQSERRQLQQQKEFPESSLIVENPSLQTQEQKALMHIYNKVMGCHRGS